METVAFICAMPLELVPLVERLSLVATEVDGLTVHEGSVHGHRAVAIVTGMGTELATTGTTQLLDAIRVDRVMVVGITGALEDETPIGTLVRPARVVDGVTGVAHEHTPIGGGVTSGTMWTAYGLTTDPQRLAELRAEGVVSLDMETSAIAAVCAARGIPWSVFRAISDRASDGSVDEEVFGMSNLDGTLNHEALEAYVQAHPERIPTLIQMSADCQLATVTAAEAAIEALREATLPAGG